MNVLMVGSGSGSWQMRGVQLGQALGARVVTAPSEADLRWSDVVVLVKRAGLHWCAFVQGFKKPIVWDALDFWRQPAQNHLSETDARALLKGTIATIKPALVIGATEAMACAAREMGQEAVYLPHHGWHGLEPTPARDAVQVVAYQGSERYLGRWRVAIEQACAQRSWRFVINPASLADADILVSFRDGEWDGWMCREWKSGVKLVNAILAGRPMVTQESAARRELEPISNTVNDVAGLGEALDEWAPIDARAHVADAWPTRLAACSLDAVASRYRDILQSVGVPCSA